MKQMKFQALILATALSMAGSAHAVNTLGLVDSYTLGTFGPGVSFADAFQVSTSGTIDHALGFTISAPLYAGSGVQDIPLDLTYGSFTVSITDINNLSAQIFDSSNTLYTSFVQNGDLDHLTLPASSYFSAGNYTLKIGGTASGTSGGFYSIAAVTIPVPEPETYAMLLVGLGLVGYRLRQKNRAAG